LAKSDNKVREEILKLIRIYCQTAKIEVATSLSREESGYYIGNFIKVFPP